MARLNKEALVDELSFQDIFAEASKKQIKEFVEDFFSLIADKTVAGDEIAIAGFGKFESFTRSNGVKTPKFRPAKAFKDALAES